LIFDKNGTLQKNEKKMPETNTLFEIETRIGKIKTTKGYWEIITHKHSEVRDLLAIVKKVLKKPDQIRRSKVDKDVYLFYMKLEKYWLAVVTKRLNHEGFVITAYLTSKIKEGERIWPR